MAKRKIRKLAEELKARRAFLKGMRDGIIAKGSLKLFEKNILINSKRTALAFKANNKVAKILGLRSELAKATLQLEDKIIYRSGRAGRKPSRLASLKLEEVADARKLLKVLEVWEENYTQSIELGRKIVRDNESFYKEVNKIGCKPLEDHKELFDHSKLELKGELENLKQITQEIDLLKDLLAKMN